MGKLQEPISNTHYTPNRRVYKHGNSLVLTIPLEYIQDAKIVPGQMMHFMQDPDGYLVIQPGRRPDVWAEHFRKRPPKENISIKNLHRITKAWKRKEEMEKELEKSLIERMDREYLSEDEDA